MVIDAA
jgi:hypothetical protein